MLSSNFSCSFRTPSHLFICLHSRVLKWIRDVTSTWDLKRTITRAESSLLRGFLSQRARQGCAIHFRKRFNVTFDGDVCVNMSSGCVGAAKWIGLHTRGHFFRCTPHTLSLTPSAGNIFNSAGCFVYNFLFADFGCINLDYFFFYDGELWLLLVFLSNLHENRWCIHLFIIMLVLSCEKGIYWTLSCTLKPDNTMSCPLCNRCP